MIHATISRSLMGAVLLAGLAQTGLAQSSDGIAPEDSFSLESAILDTSIPFAVGAHEARQELRGAFGWPTFQEGLVEGVYFRFDPDGYARFAATPRLDTDVFEVICRPRTHVCMARKGAMNVTLNSKNQIQLEIENITEADQFSIVDGISQLNLPNDILRPLDARMELLLSEGGDLLISRAQKEVDRVSLTGFAAVTAYLRWVSAQQSYNVLPRDWPIPNASPHTSSALLTQTASWQTPTLSNPSFGSGARSPEVAEVRGELNVLREMIFDQPHNAAMKDSEKEQSSASLQELQLALQMLGDEVAKLRVDEMAYSGGQTASILSDAKGPNSVSIQADVETREMGTAAPAEMHEVALHLNYLISVIGMEPSEAVSVLYPDIVAQSCAAIDASIADTMGHDGGAVMTQNHISAPIHQNVVPAGQRGAGQIAEVPESEYQLLSNYFRSVFEEK